MELSEALGDPVMVAGTRRDPVPMINRLREQDPVCWLPGFDAWFVTRHEDVQLLFADPRLTTDPRVYQRYRVPTDPTAARWLSEIPFRSTPSDPESLGRRLVSRAFTPRTVARMEEQVLEVVEQFAAPLRRRSGEVDLIREFTTPVATAVLGRILGVPPKYDDGIRFRELAAGATRSIHPMLSVKKQERAERAGVEIAEYVLGLVEERKKCPREDLISDLLRASDAGSSASTEDMVRVVAGLVAVGTGTASTAAARGLRSLLQHREQLALLRRDRSLLPNAVSELLRYDSGLIVIPRYVLEELQLRERVLEKGQLVALCPMAANRDPRVFSDPEKLDLRRETKDALSFGQGPHHCVGANLGRLELRAMFEAALDFLPPCARILEDKTVWSKRGMLSQMKSLPVDFGQAPGGCPEGAEPRN